MSWLIAQTWLLLLAAFVLGSAVAWLAARVFLPRLKEAR
jgi:hypothetical protein